MTVTYCLIKIFTINYQDIRQTSDAGCEVINFKRDEVLERLISKINGEYTDIIEVDVNHQITYRQKKVRKVESNNQEK